MYQTVTGLIPIYTFNTARIKQNATLLAAVADGESMDFCLDLAQPKLVSLAPKTNSYVYPKPNSSHCLNLLDNIRLYLLFIGILCWAARWRFERDSCGCPSRHDSPEPGDIRFNAAA